MARHPPRPHSHVDRQDHAALLKGGGLLHTVIVFLAAFGCTFPPDVPGPSDLPTTTRVSLSSDGVEGNHTSGQPSIKAEGRFVALESSARNLVRGDPNAATDIFVRDRGP